MGKKSKLATPDWIIEGYDSKAEYEKAKGIKNEKKSGKTSQESEILGSTEPRAAPTRRQLKSSVGFKIRECPKCGSDDVGIVLSNSDAEDASGTGKEWECRKCKWKGSDIIKKDLTEEELMDYMDNPKKSKIFGATEFKAVPTHRTGKNSVGNREGVA